MLKAQENRCPHVSRAEIVLGVWDLMPVHLGRQQAYMHGAREYLRGAAVPDTLPMASSDFRGETLQLHPRGQQTQLSYWDRRRNIVSN